MEMAILVCIQNKIIKNWYFKKILMILTVFKFKARFVNC